MPEKLTYNKYNDFNENAKFFYRYFISKGLSSIASAGIVGNLIQESTGGSGVNTNITSGVGSYGAAQWTGDRLTNLSNYAKSRNLPVHDRKVQAEFLWNELTSSTYKKALDGLKSAKTIRDATNIFVTDFEKAGKPEIEKRVKYAESVFDPNFNYLSEKAKDNHTEPKIDNDISWKWKLKHGSVGVSKLNKNILSYFNTLEPEYQDLILATAGSDGKHSINSRHYKNNAVDLRFNDKLYNRIKNDPKRLKYGLSLIDPNHGTAPHIHLSYGNGSENKKDVWVDPFSDKAKKYTNGEFFQDHQDHQDHFNEEKNTSSFSDVDSQSFQEYIDMMKEELGKKEDEQKIEQEKAQIRNNLIKKQQERDYLLAQALSVNLPFVERKY